MGDSLQKTCVVIIALSLAAIATQLTPVSKKAKAWNRCLDTTGIFLAEIHSLQEKGHLGREAIAVNICNGAVHYNKAHTPSTIQN